MRVRALGGYHQKSLGSHVDVRAVVGLLVVVNGHVSRLSGCQCNSTDVRGSFLQTSMELNGRWGLPLDVNGQWWATSMVG